MTRFPIRLLSVIAAVAILLQTCGQLFILAGVRMAARIEAKARVRSMISPEQFTKVVVDRVTLQTDGCTLTWKEDDEFVMGESMYDVLRRYDSSDVTVIVAVRDGADSWWHAAIGREQDRQSRQRTHSGPVGQLLAHLASIKAVTGEIILPVPPVKILRGHMRQPSEPLCSGHSTSVDRPPLMA